MPSGGRSALELVDRHDQQSRGRYFRGNGPSASDVSDGGGSASNGGTAAVSPRGSPKNGYANVGNGGGGGAASATPGATATIAKIPGLSKLSGAVRVGGRNIGGDDNREDLIFSVEDGGIHGGGSQYDNIDDPNDDYAGLERDLEDRLRRRTWRRILAAGSLAAAFCAGALVHVNRAGKVSPDSVNGHPHDENRPSNPPPKPYAPSAPSPSPPSPKTPPATPTVDETVVDTEEGVQDIDTLASLWPTVAPAPPFAICSPPLTPDRKSDKKNQKSKHPLPIYHISTLITVPEAPRDGDGDEDLDLWEYTFSSMDVSDDASIIAVGLADFSADTEWDVGMVRAFAWSCDDGGWRQLGQDLRGSNQYEQFGYQLSSSRDGKVMAVSAPQESYEGGDGFVIVYYLDEDNNRWERLGGRIDDVKSATGIGHALDLSDGGDTLAVLGVADTNTYTVRVFRYDPDSTGWKRKGRDISVSVNYADDYEFAPQLSLSGDSADTLSISDPEFGVVRYRFHFAKNRWEKQSSKTVSFDSNDYWIDSVDVDDSGDVIAFTALEEQAGDGADYDYEAVKVVDFSSGEADEVYSSSYTDFAVGVNVAVSDDGRVAAVVASKYDVDDDEFWSGEDVVGALTVLTKERADGDAGAGGEDGVMKWGVLGKGTDAEGMGVPGSFVTLAGSGKILAVGSADVVALYAVVVSDYDEEGPDDGSAGDDQEGEEANGATEEEILDGDAIPAENGPFQICAPFSDAAVGASADGNLDSLPSQLEGHSTSLASNADASVIAVGIDSYDGEDRGLARVFGWSCDAGAYVQMGQDLLGTEEFDGFGQSVDLSSDGFTLAVGANQPPPGKSGYVEVYAYDRDDGTWSILGSRIDGFNSHSHKAGHKVGDAGREVRISRDGLTLALSGSVVASSQYDYDSSFVRVLTYSPSEDGGSWTPKGSDLIGSVGYDDYGSEAHISLSGDGSTLGVVGSYDEFLVKIYSYDTSKKNWTEHVVAPPRDAQEEDEEIEEEYVEYFDDDTYDFSEVEEWDVYYDYFTGRDVALNLDGSVVAVAGTRYTISDEDALVRVLWRDTSTEGANWTLSPDPVDVSRDYALSSVDVSDDGRTLAVGINIHSDGKDGGYGDQGAMFVASLLTREELEDEDSDGGTSTLGWTSLGEVDGASEDDLLGSRVTVSGDGKVAAASSRRGYVSFFKAG